MIFGVPKSDFFWIDYLKERVAAIDAEMALGKHLGQAMDDAGFDFPSADVIDDLIVYGTLPNFDKQIGPIAREELEECVLYVRNKLKILQICLLFLVVGLIFFVLLALSSLQQAVGYLQV